MTDFAKLLQRSAARHSHLCPRQVLGVRMGLAGLARMGLKAPVSKPTGLIIVETDGCFVDGIEVATGAAIGHRTLRVVDMGKIAATIVDVKAGMALRFAPKAGVRSLASSYAPESAERYTAQLEGYQVMPDEELFKVEEVFLDPPLLVLLSTPDVRVTCSTCGEEIINGRELAREGTIQCRTCSGDGYYAVKRPLATSDGMARD